MEPERIGKQTGSERGRSRESKTKRWGKKDEHHVTAGRFFPTAATQRWIFRTPRPDAIHNQSGESAAKFLVSLAHSP